MSDKSNNQGRAYEFVCLLSLGEEIGKFRPVNIVQNSSYLAAEYAWNTLSPEMKNIYKVSSYAAVIQIFELEPRIMEKGGDVLELRIQSLRDLINLFIGSFHIYLGFFNSFFQDHVKKILSAFFFIKPA